MRIKLAYRFIVPMLCLTLLGGPGITSIVAQTVVGQTSTTTVNKATRTVTVVTITYYSDGTYLQTVHTWTYIEDDGGTNQN
jgi:hypothetical protein